MAEAVAARLREGLELEDSDFDRLYPGWARYLSTIHWTPVGVARRAAELLVTRPGMRVLDVGAGVGKFCIVGALTSEGDFTGVELREHFVRASEELARELGAERARFVHGDMRSLDWREFDAFYLYNPFAEHDWTGEQPLDRTTSADPQLYNEYTRFVRNQLHAAAPGTRVVTYHGFGADMPSSYEQVDRPRIRHEMIELWVKT